MRRTQPTFLHWREKKRMPEHNQQSQLETESEKEITKQADILLEQTRFYKQLHQEENTLQDTEDAYISDFLGQNWAPSALAEHEQTFCGGKISESEIAEALREMKNGSAPGSDGLTTEFYN